MDKPPFGIAVSDCKTPMWFQRYPNTSTCLPNRMCDVLPFAKKMRDYVTNDEDKAIWTKAIAFYEGMQHPVKKEYETECSGGRRRTRRRGARASRKRPTR